MHPGTSSKPRSAFACGSAISRQAQDTSPLHSRRKSRRDAPNPVSSGTKLNPVSNKCKRKQQRKTRKRSTGSCEEAVRSIQNRWPGATNSVCFPPFDARSPTPSRRSFTARSVFLLPHTFSRVRLPGAAPMERELRGRRGVEKDCRRPQDAQGESDVLRSVYLSWRGELATAPTETRSTEAQARTRSPRFVDGRLAAARPPPAAPAPHKAIRDGRVQRRGRWPKAKSDRAGPSFAPDPHAPPLPRAPRTHMHVRRRQVGGAHCSGTETGARRKSARARAPCRGRRRRAGAQQWRKEKHWRGQRDQRGTANSFPKLAPLHPPKGAMPILEERPAFAAGVRRNSWRRPVESSLRGDMVGARKESLVLSVRSIH